MNTETVETFTHALGVISHSRAGWDYDLSPQERAKELADEKSALGIARMIWTNNPDMHDDLKSAFAAASPLATLDEITRPAA